MFIIGYLLGGYFRTRYHRQRFVYQHKRLLKWYNSSGITEGQKFKIEEILFEYKWVCWKVFKIREITWELDKTLSNKIHDGYIKSTYTKWREGLSY